MLILLSNTTNLTTLTFKNITLSLCLLSCLTLFSKSHIKQYEVMFQSGSSFVSPDVQQQVMNIYNQIPELQYSTIKCHGLDDEASSNYMLHALARERAKKIQKVFLMFGMHEKHVKISYSTLPIVLVFKPKAILKTSSLVTKELEKHKKSHLLRANKKSYLVSNHDHLYIFAAFSFETEEGIVVKKGIIDVQLTELCTNDDVVKCGVVGKQNTIPHEYGMYFKLEAFHKGEKLKLRQGYVYKVMVNDRLVKHNMSLYKGSVVDQVMVWRINKQAKVQQKYLSKGENKDGNTIMKKLLSVKEGYKTALIINNLGWSKCTKNLSFEKTDKIMLSVVFNEKHAVYLVSNETKMIIPAVENLNFKDLYEFINVPINESFQVVALPINNTSQTYIFNREFNTSIKFSSIETSKCATSSAYNCVHIK